MQYLNKEFCPVCREAIIESLHNRVKVIAECEPVSTTTVTMEEEEMTFAITRYYKGTGNTVNFQWSLDGKVLENETTDQLVIKCDSLDASRTIHTVRLKAHEINTFVKDPKHESNHTTTITWRLKLGETVGIEAYAHEDFSIESRSGGLFFKSEKPRAVTIYNLHGHRVAHLNICGEELINLPKGLYIIDGKKMLVD